MFKCSQIIPTASCMMVLAMDDSYESLNDGMMVPDLVTSPALIFAVLGMCG